MVFPPETLVQIQNDFTELFLMMASTKIAQTVMLGLIQGSPELEMRNVFKLHPLITDPNLK